MLDDDTKKFGMSLLGSIQVKGAIVDVQYWVDELAIEQIIIAIPSSSLKERKRISLLCNSTGVDVRIVPSVDQLASGNVNIREIRKLSMEDLLGREEINLNIPEVVEFLKDKRVLVTGAGGMRANNTKNDSPRGLRAPVTLRLGGNIGALPRLNEKPGQ